METFTFLGRNHNNFDYLVKSAHAFSFSEAARMGTVPVPRGTKEVIMWFPNPAANLNEEVRIPNQVAAMVLMRNALSKYDQKVVPDVYGWASDDSGFSWIMQEYMGGDTLSDLASLNPDNQKQLLSQAASIFKAIQDYQLPERIKAFGGLNFDAEGNVIAGPMPIDSGGPFSKFEDMYKALLPKQMDLASQCPVIADRKANGLEERLNNFLQSNQIERIVTGLSTTRKTLVHGYFSK